ncbi:MAG: hypothetical protein AB7G08_26300 [Hyphomicrobiaceae bacterium]
MSRDQLAFTGLLAEADERASAMRDTHRGRVQAFFDELDAMRKKQLAEWMMEAEWDTCVALSVAACDHYCRRMDDRAKN